VIEARPIKSRPFESGRVKGFFHEAPGGAGLALTHGAGTNCEAPLLVAVAEAFASAGLSVLRFDLAFRLKRKFGPPHPALAAADRETIREAALALRKAVSGPVYAGGHSYGGRQTSILAAQDATIASAL